MAFNRKACVACSDTFFPTRSHQDRCVPCRTALSKERHAARGRARSARHREERLTLAQTCEHCHKEFHATRQLRYCTRAECRRERNTIRMRQYFEEYEERTGSKYVIKRDPEARQRNSAERRARQRGARVGEPFTRQYVGERDSWQCALCGEPIDPTLKWPDPMSQSLEHIVPLALGGEHVKENCTIAHLSCNSRGGTRHAQARARMLRHLEGE